MAQKKKYKKGSYVMARSLTSLLVEDEIDYEEQKRNEKYKPPYIQMRPGDIGYLVLVENHSDRLHCRIKFCIEFDGKVGVVKFVGRTKEMAQIVMEKTFIVVTKREAGLSV